MTDEGFNIHNARNVVLFGHASTDDYNNSLFSPLLHFTQVGVFRLIGVGSAQARLISITCGLLTLVFLWAALQRALDHKIALTAVIFLGLDHTNLLFNRMALMDTPAALVAVAAFYALTRSVADTRNQWRNQKWLWLVLCGALIAIAVTVRSVVLYLAPVPFFIFAWEEIRRPRGQEADHISLWKISLTLALSMILVFVIYFILWYQPHRAQLAVLNAYYKRRQIPASVGVLASNIYNALFGSAHSVFSYLFHHTPVLFFLVLLGLTVRPKARAFRVELYLIAWLVFGWALLASTSYAPSRYYVTTYPALAALAAISLWRLPEIWEKLQRADRRITLIRALLFWYLIYQTGSLMLDHFGLLSHGWATLVLILAPTIGALAELRFSMLRRLIERDTKLFQPRRLAIIVMVLWFAINGYWLSAWLLRLQYTQYQMSHWLAQNLPPGSVLIGDVAPGVCLDNNFVAVYVEPRLWNDVAPIEAMGARYPGAKRYIVMDDRWKYRYWNVRYPNLITSDRQIKSARVLNWQVGVYEVDR